MEHLSGETLVRKDKSNVEADEALKDKELIAIYFSAHWCPPCKEFTPILARYYKECLDMGYQLEIIFVTSDESEEAFFSYMNESHGDWLAAPFGSELIGKLEGQFNVDGIPFLAIIKKDGTVITENGREEVEDKGMEAFKELLGTK